MSDPTAAGLRHALAEFGLELPTPLAQHALGRLVGLELASWLGSRHARRALARERESLLRTCFGLVAPVDGATVRATVPPSQEEPS